MIIIFFNSVCNYLYVILIDGIFDEIMLSKRLVSSLFLKYVSFTSLKLVINYINELFKKLQVKNTFMNKN